MPGGKKRSYIFIQIMQQLLSADLFKYYGFLLPPGFQGLTKNKL